MADSTAAQLLTELNIQARDGSDITFSNQEKQRAVTKAIADRYVTKLTRDTSITTLALTDHYTVPTGMSVLRAGLQMSTYGKSTPLEGWGVIGGVIYLSSLPPTGKTLVLTGKLKLADTDTIPDDRCQYVLTLAKMHLVDYLMASLGTTFLTNDMTMGDLLRLKGTLQQEAIDWRAQFHDYTVEL